eukprot:scaffold369172_cov24-Attheya_sp.AAC.1
MAGVAWRSALDRCGLTREAIHAICEEGYADTDDSYSCQQGDDSYSCQQPQKEERDYCPSCPKPKSCDGEIWIRLHPIKHEEQAVGISSLDPHSF